MHHDIVWLQFLFLISIQTLQVVATTTVQKDWEDLKRDTALINFVNNLDIEISVYGISEDCYLCAFKELVPHLVNKSEGLKTFWLFFFFFF